MRSLLSIVILGALSSAGVSTARAEDGPVKGIEFGWRGDRDGNPIDDRVVYVGFEENFQAIPYGEGGAVTRPDGSIETHLKYPMEIRVDGPFDAQSMDFLGPTLSDTGPLHVFTVKPTYHGERTGEFRFDVMYSGRQDVLFSSQSFYFEVRHCLNGTWEDPKSGRKLKICQDGDTVYAEVQGPLLCHVDVERFRGTLEGEELTGEITTCAPEWCFEHHVTEERVPRAIRGRQFVGKISKKGTSLHAFFETSIKFNKKHNKDFDEFWCEMKERRNPNPVASNAAFYRIEQFGNFSPRCGAPCTPPSEVPTVTVPGLE